MTFEQAIAKREAAIAHGNVAWSAVIRDRLIPGRWVCLIRHIAPHIW